MSFDTKESGASRASVLKSAQTLQGVYAPGINKWRGPQSGKSCSQDMGTHTQVVIALSSGEAEYSGMVKGASYSLGIKSLASNLGLEWGQQAIEICTD